MSPAWVAGSDAELSPVQVQMAGGDRCRNCDGTPTILGVAGRRNLRNFRFRCRERRRQEQELEQEGRRKLGALSHIVKFNSAGCD